MALYRAYNLRVQGVNTLYNDNLLILSAQQLPLFPCLIGKVKGGDLRGQTVEKSVQMLVQQL